MPWAKRSTKKPIKKVYKKKTYKRKATVSATVKKYIKRTIARTEEMKYATPDSALNGNIIAAAAAGATVYYPISLSVPFSNITQGVTESGRIGNEIRLKKWIVKGYFTPVTGEVNAICEEQIIISHFIGYRRDYQPITNTLIRADLFNTGTTYTGASATFIDSLYDINKDNYVILWRRTYKMGTSTNAANLANNDYKLTQHFKVDLCRHGFKDRSVKYNDTVVTTSDAKINGVYMWSLVMNASGAALTPGAMATQCTYDISHITTVQYTDS